MSFTVCGLRVHLDFTFFAMLGLFLCLNESSYLWWTLSALLLHEIGHLLSALLTGIRMKELSFSCFGIRLMREERILTDWKRELFVYAGGPLMNLFCFGILFLLEKEVPCVIHLLLGCFQLLPIGALDGGCMMKLLLEHCCLPDMAEKLGMAVSCGALLPLFWFGIRLFCAEKSNFTLILCCFFLLLTILSEGPKKS